jgi:hypothetical protein
MSTRNSGLGPVDDIEADGSEHCAAPTIEFYQSRV